MATGENEHGLHKIMDLTRLLSVFVLLLHFYTLSLTIWPLPSSLELLWSAITRTGILSSMDRAKAMSFLFLFISLVGNKARRDPDVKIKSAVLLLAGGTLLFWLSHLFLLMSINLMHVFQLYCICTFVGYLGVLAGGSRLSRIIQIKLRGDIFNSLNESFPQEERLLKNEYSINLAARYKLHGKIRKSWINVINPFRALLVVGTPGAGKSFFIIRNIILQHIAKGFTMFIYDFKFDDLSIIAYNTIQANTSGYKIPPRFYVINFEDLSRTHRCNPLDPMMMTDITDAAESARTIMLGLNRDWIKKQGDFFVESPINFVTAIIWFLKKYEEGRYCTLPHVIELMQLDYATLFPLLRKQPEVDVLVNPFESAFRHEAWEQLEGQVASAKIAMARLSSPQLYYVLSGNDFSLDINNPAEPKIVCMGNNPQKQQIFGAVLSLYISRMIKIINKKGMAKSSLIFDEFPTIYFNGIDGLIATARSNKVATTLAVQDYSQLKKDYGRDQAEVIMNIAGNIISGQVLGDTAKMLSERFGRIVQERSSVSINSNDVSVSRSTQLDYAIPAAKIAALSSGEFVGMIADNPDEKISTKVFNAEILADVKAIQKEERAYEAIPTIRMISQEEITDNYLGIRQDIAVIIDDLLNTQHS